MPTQTAITLYENNDEKLTLTITTNNPTAGTVLDLTGKTVEVFLKVNASTADDDATSWKGSTVTGEVILTTPAAGICTVDIPATAVTINKAWWRCDVIASTKRKTAAYGTVSVTNT